MKLPCCLSKSHTSSVIRTRVTLTQNWNYFMRKGPISKHYEIIIYFFLIIGIRFIFHISYLWLKPIVTLVFPSIHTLLTTLEQNFNKWLNIVLIRDVFVVYTALKHNERLSLTYCHEGVFVFIYELELNHFVCIPSIYLWYT